MQGFGNVGSVSADLLAGIGAKIVAVTDWKGGVYNANGPRRRGDARLREDAQVDRRLPRRRAARPTTQLFALDVDVLDSGGAREPGDDGQRAVDQARRSWSRAPTARPRPTRTSTCTSAASSSFPTSSPTPAASPRRNLEWVQDRHGYFWELDEVNTRLEQKMVEAFDDVLQTSVKYKVDLRTAAYIVAHLARRQRHQDARHVRVT